MECESNGNFEPNDGFFDSNIVVEDNVEDMDIAAAGSQLQMEEGGVDGQENQNSSEPILEEDDMELVKLMELEKSIGISADVGNNVEDMDIAVAGSQLQMEEGGVDGQENQNSSEPILEEDDMELVKLMELEKSIGISADVGNNVENMDIAAAGSQLQMEEGGVDGQENQNSSEPILEEDDMELVKLMELEKSIGISADVGNNVEDMDIAVAGSQLQMEEGGVDGQENQNSSEPILEEDDMELVKLMELEKSIGISADVGNNVENMDIAAAGSQLQMEEGGVDGQENQNSSEPILEEDDMELVKLMELEKSIGISADVGNNVEDMDIAVAGSQLQMEEGGVDGQENQNSSEPILEEDDMELVKLMELEKSIGISADVGNNVEDMDIAVAGSQLQMEEGGVDGQENQNSSEPILEEDDMELVKLMELEKSIGISADVGNNVEDMDIAVAGSQLQMEEGGVDGQENQNSSEPILEEDDMELVKLMELEKSIGISADVGNNVEDMDIAVAGSQLQMEEGGVDGQENQNSSEPILEEDDMELVKLMELEKSIGISADVGNNVEDMDIAVAGSQLQMEEGGVDGQENQNSSEPILEEDDMELVKLMELEKSIGISADVGNNVEDMDIAAAGSQLQMEEGGVDGQKNQSSDEVPVSEDQILIHNTEVEPMTMNYIFGDQNDEPTINIVIGLSPMECVGNTENENNTIENVANVTNVENVVNPPEAPIVEVDANTFDEAEMEALKLLELPSECRDKEPKLIDAKDLHAYPNAFVQCAVCDQIFSSESFKIHFCELYEMPSTSTANENDMRSEISLGTRSIDILYNHADRLMRENQIRMNQFLKSELHYEPKKKVNRHRNKKIEVDSGEKDADATKLLRKENDSHECTLCKRKFVRASGLLKHIEKHDPNEWPIPAGSTPINEDSEKLMNAAVECTTCGRVFFDPEDACAHYLNHVPTISEPYEPKNNCDYSLHLAEAMQLLTNNREETNELVDQSPQLSEPGMKCITIMSVFQCEFCDFLFTDVNFLLKHSGQHVPNRPFECFSCEIYMHTVKEISAHWTVECVFRRELYKRWNFNALCYFVCNVCEQKFPSRELLIKHRYIEFHFFPRMNKYLNKLQLPCEYCRSVYNCVPDIVAHYEQQHYAKEISKSMSDEKLRPYLCDICGKTYTQSSHLWLHLRLHQGVTPFKCKEPSCARKFTTRTDLNDHIRKCHTGNRPYFCIICNKRFLTGSVYYQHRLIHQKDRRFVCRICSKRFYRADTLKIHQRIHTGEKPFNCSYCTKSFRQRGDRDKHVRARHGHLNKNELQLLQNQKMRLEAKEAAGCSSAALQDQETSTETSTAETPQQEDINQYAKKDDMQDEKQKDKKNDLVVDSEDDGEDNLTADVENDLQDNEQPKKPKYRSLPELD